MSHNTTTGSWPPQGPDGACELHSPTPCECAQRVNDAGRIFRSKKDNFVNLAKSRPLVRFLLEGSRDLVVGVLIATFATITPGPSHAHAPTHPPRHCRPLESGTIEADRLLPQPTNRN